MGEVLICLRYTYSEREGERQRERRKVSSVIPQLSVTARNGPAQIPKVRTPSASTEWLGTHSKRLKLGIEPMLKPRV